MEIFNSDKNVFKCSFVGTDATGTSALGNSGNGIFLNQANGNTVGGTAGDGNLISGNLLSGILIQNSDADTVLGNIVGLNANGSGAVNNVLNGIHILNSSNTVIGGTDSAARNVVSGNTGTGILVQANAALTTPGTIIQGNYIGLNASGSVAAGVGNSADGVRTDGADVTDTLIGGSVAGARNVISNNSPFGIRTQGLGSNLTIKGNFIGTNAAGNADAGNSQTGVGVSGTNIIIGGTTAAERNVISGNDTGVFIGGILTTGVVHGNYIGLGANGSQVINNSDGVVVVTPLSILIGGTTSGSR